MYLLSGYRTASLRELHPASLLRSVSYGMPTARAILRRPFLLDLRIRQAS